MAHRLDYQPDDHTQKRQSPLRLLIIAVGIGLIIVLWFISFAVNH